MFLLAQVCHFYWSISLPFILVKLDSARLYIVKDYLKQIRRTSLLYHPNNMGTISCTLCTLKLINSATLWTKLYGIWILVSKMYSPCDRPGDSWIFMNIVQAEQEPIFLSPNFRLYKNRSRLPMKSKFA